MSDGDGVYLPGVMEHIERAGVHSGDSLAVFPAVHVTADERDQIIAHTVAIARALHVRGFLNIQFVIKDGTVYVLEANLRSSRTVPFVSKAAGVPLVPIAIRVMLGASLADLGYPGITLLPPPPLRYAAAHARAALTHPLRYLGALALSLRLSTGGARALLWRAFYFAEAVRLWDECRRRRLAGSGNGERLHVRPPCPAPPFPSALPP